MFPSASITAPHPQIQAVTPHVLPGSLQSPSLLQGQIPQIPELPLVMSLLPPRDCKFTEEGSVPVLPPPGPCTCLVHHGTQCPRAKGALWPTWCFPQVKVPGPTFLTCSCDFDQGGDLQQATPCPHKEALQSQRREPGWWVGRRQELCRVQVTTGYVMDLCSSLGFSEQNGTKASRKRDVRERCGPRIRRSCLSSGHGWGISRCVLYSFFATLLVWNIS